MITHTQSTQICHLCDVINVNGLAKKYRDNIDMYRGIPYASWLGTRCVNGELDTKIRVVMRGYVDYDCYPYIDVIIPYTVPSRISDNVIIDAPSSATLLTYNDDGRIMRTKMTRDLSLTLLFYGAFFDNPSFLYASQQLTIAIESLLMQQGVIPTP